MDVRSVFILLAAATILAPSVRPLHATEPSGPLEMQAKLVEVRSSASSSGRTEGTAIIEIVLQSFVGTKDIHLDVLKPNGSVWASRGGPFSPATLRWTREHGTGLEEIGNGAAALQPGELARLQVTVPLETAEGHEIVLRVSGIGPEGILRAEDAVRAPLGEAAIRPSDDGTVSEYRAVSSSGVSQ